MEQKRVFILVKTYPTISEKYSELVCTAGVLEDLLVFLDPNPYYQAQLQNQKFLLA